MFVSFLTWPIRTGQPIGTLILRENHFSHLQFPWLLIFICIGLSPHGCFSHLFWHFLWCSICSDIIWAVMLVKLQGQSFWHYQDTQPHRKFSHSLDLRVFLSPILQCSLSLRYRIILYIFPMWLGILILHFCFSVIFCSGHCLL